MFTYPVAGQNSIRGGSVGISSYTSGDVKWVFDRVAVTPGMTYQFNEFYTANTITELVIEYTKTDNTLSYISLGAVAAAANWTPVQQTFTVPVGVQSATVFHILKSIGNLTIDTASLTAQTNTLYMTGNLISNPSVEISTPTNP